MELGGSDVNQTFSSLVQRGWTTPCGAIGWGHTEAHVVHPLPKGEGQDGHVGVGKELVTLSHDEDTVLLSANARLPEEPWGEQRAHPVGVINGDQHEREFRSSYQRPLDPGKGRYYQLQIFKTHLKTPTDSKQVNDHYNKSLLRYKTASLSSITSTRVLTHVEIFQHSCHQ